MHLDMVLSTVGKHAFTVHGPLAQKMEVFTVEKNGEGKKDPSMTEWVSHGCNVSRALRKLLNDPELIFYGAVDEETSTHEQRHCQHNVVVIDNYHVVTLYDECHTTTSSTVTVFLYNAKQPISFVYSSVTAGRLRL
jgi:arginine deiminase